MVYLLDSMEYKRIENVMNRLYKENLKLGEARDLANALYAALQSITPAEEDNGQTTRINSGRI